MAGGSSDAAAAFVGVNRLFRLGLSEEELMKRAVPVSYTHLVIKEETR